MKKILSVVLVLAMVLALGVTAFAVNPTDLEAGKTVGFSFNVPTKDGIIVTDTNGILVFGDPVIGTDTVAVNVTAPAGTEGKVTKIVVTTKNLKDKQTELTSQYISVVKPAAPAAPEAGPVLNVADLAAALKVDANNVATVNMGAVNGVSAEVYNTLKTANYEKIVFVGNGYTWTLTRGDYTKMNVTASIYFGVSASSNLYDKDGKVDLATENLVLKALGNTKADVFYIKVADNSNIGNVASKPELVVKVPDAWITYNNRFAVTAYKFDGETVAKAADGLAIKPATGKMALSLTAAGTYVFVGDNTAVTPTKPATGKPNAGTGANNAAAAVVALAVMAVAAVASKKIVK